MTRNPDDIMAEHLLTGGKMLSEACPACGAPLFEINGVKQCVVCKENNTAPTQKQPSTPAISSPSSTPAAENLRVIVPAYAKDESLPASPLAEELDALIHTFIQRAHNETDSSRCLTYMECIRTAAEAKTMLVRHR